MRLNKMNVPVYRAHNTIFGRPSGIAWAPNDLSGIPDDTSDDDGLGDGDRIDDSDAIDENDENQEINDDGLAGLQALFGKVEGEEESDDESEDEYPTIEEERESLRATMEADITGFGLPENIIPENFNPADPKQLRDVLAKSQQAGMRQAIAVMFKPVQATLNRMQRNVDSQIATSISGAQGATAFESALLAAIPAAGNELVRPMLNPLIEAAKKRHPKDQAAQVKAIRAGMIATGMNPKGVGKPTKSGNERGQNVSRILDLFAPKPESQPERTRRKIGGKQ